MKSFYAFLFAALCMLPLTAQAKPPHQTVTLDYMHGTDNIDGLRFAYRPLTQQWQTDWLGTFNLYWEGSVNLWEYGEQDTHSSNYALSLSPVFLKRLTSLGGQYPLYAEFGVGVSVVNDKTFAGKHIGSHFQFEDRLGLTLSLNEPETSQITLRYIHYSNAGLSDKNPGLDFLSLSYAYHF